jgi:hypothetical protein
VNHSKHYHHRVTITGVDLDFDGIGVNAVDGGGTDTSEHWEFLRLPALNAIGIFYTRPARNSF